MDAPPFKLYKRNGLWIALHRQEFVVLGEAWGQQDQVVYRPQHGLDSWDEVACVQFARENGID